MPNTALFGKMPHMQITEEDASRPSVAPTPPDLLVKPEMMPELLGPRRLTSQSANTANLHISAIVEHKQEDSFDPSLEVRHLLNS